MIDMSQLDLIEKVYYHNDMDGIGSREILKLCLRNINDIVIQYIPYEHNVTQLDKKNLNNTLFIDCSPNIKVVNEYMQTCDNLLIADHHQSFIDAIQGLYSDRTLLPEDMKVEGYKNSDDISGVTLALYIAEVIYKDKFDKFDIDTKCKVYAFERYISIADTFCKDDPYEFAIARNFSTYLMENYGDYLNFIPSREILLTVHPGNPYDLNKKDKIKKIAEDALICTPDTVSKKIVTAFVNNIDNISDIAEYLRENENINLVIGYLRVGDQHIISLRSDDSFDCKELAVRHGGGGHKKAAGFMIDVKDPVLYLENFIYSA